MTQTWDSNQTPMVSTSKAPVDLSIAVRKHHDPQVESQVCVICPRRKGKPTDKRSGTSPVALSLDFLRPLFKKPLTQVSEELGLSATAIKKACRRFGVPKWPFRTLTAKTSRNRTTFEGAPSPQVHAGFANPEGTDARHQNPMNEDMKLKEDAKMIKEVAALAAAREENKTKPLGVAEQEMAAARNLNLFSGPAGADGKVDLAELQMQYIRAWQQQQQQALLVEGANLPKLAGLGGDVSVKNEAGDGAPQLPCLNNGLILPPPNPILAFPGQGGAAQVLYPVPVTGLGMHMMNGMPFAMPGTIPGVPMQMLVPAMLPTSLPLSGNQ
mmetsp:Transcript_32588/g.66133  ORF Transcript_32588/g.66133 Transcript_32588/m.66133 type:complete len:326 (+) Transcript_32588:2-979(+)